MSGSHVRRMPDGGTLHICCHNKTYVCAHPGVANTRYPWPAVPKRKRLERLKRYVEAQYELEK